MTTTASPPVDAVQRRVLAVLSLAQILGGVGVATSISVGALVGTRLSGSEGVGGLALTAMVLGAALAAVVLSRVATRSGRRPAVALGYGAGAIGGAGSAAAVALGSAPLLLAALVLLGAATAAGLSARFAATDLAEPGRRARALALVVWATTVGAVAGPNLAGPAQVFGVVLGLPPDAGPFALCAVSLGAAAGLVFAGLRPDPLRLARRIAAGDAPGGSVVRPVHGRDVRAALRASPYARLGLAGVALGHLVMVGLMSMTPVHMDHGGASLQLIGLVISVHVAGMYALSPLFGWLADRLGRVPVLAGAAVLLLGAGVLCAVADPHATALLAAGLVVLGLGWSGCLIAGSTLLTESLPQVVRPRAQGLADVTMNVAGAAAGIAAGLTVAVSSFAVLGVVSALIVVPFLLVATALRTGAARWSAQPSR
jgi:MFS family permease